MRQTTTCRYFRRVFAGALVATNLLICSSESSAETNVVMAGGLAVPSVGYSVPATSHVGGLQFNFSPVGDLSTLLAGTPAQMALGNSVLQGFDDAGHLWSNIFSDAITVNVDIDFPSLGAGILGSAGSTTQGNTYSSVRTALIGDVTSADDGTATANLQPAGALDFITNDNSTVASPRIRDNDGSANNTVLDINTANAKAIGLRPANDPTTDAAISFSSNFTWDFDPSNGITGGSFDFVGVAAHEIGHALGFVSGVDIVDVTGGAGPSGPVDLDPFRVFSVLDMFRYSNNSTSAAGQPANGAVLDLAFGEVSGDTPFFSIDAGLNNLGTFSTGRFNGDGEQASHWEDNLGLGIMDPTLTIGNLAVITALDVQAFDVIGYDLAIIPEPTSIMLVAVGLMLSLAGKSRRTA